MTNEELKAKAESVERRSDGDYYTIPAGALTSEEFAELIMDGVRRLQSERNKNLNPLFLSSQNNSRQY